MRTMAKLSAMAWIGLLLAACDAKQDLGGGATEGGGHGEGGSASIAGPGSGAGDATSVTSSTGSPAGGTTSTATSASGDPTATTADTSSGTGGSGDGGSDTGAGGDGGGQGGGSTTCNPLEELGSSVAFSALPPPAPEAAGGTIEDGVYIITSETAYTNTNQSSAQLPAAWTLEVSGDTMTSVVAGVHQTFAMSFPSETTLMRTTLCDDQTPDAVGTSFTVDYTATPGSFTEYLVWDFGQGPEADLFTWTKLR